MFLRRDASPSQASSNDVAGQPLRRSPTFGTDDESSCYLTFQDLIPEHGVHCERHEHFQDVLASPLKMWTPTALKSRATTPRALSPSQRTQTAQSSRCRGSSAMDSLSFSTQKPPFSARTTSSKSNRRTRAEPDLGIRVVVQLPGGGRIAILVHKSARVGPFKSKPSNRFTDVWGENADELGPFAGKRSEGSSGRMTPLRTLLSQREAETMGDCANRSKVHEYDLEDGCFIPSSEVIKETSLNEQSQQVALSLKELVEVATGIEVNRQKLVHSKRGPLDNNGTYVADCDIKDGSVIKLSVKPNLKHSRIPQSISRCRHFTVIPQFESRHTNDMGKKGSRVECVGTTHVLHSYEPFDFRRNQAVPSPRESKLVLSDGVSLLSKTNAAMKVTQVIEPLPSWLIRKAAPVGSEFPPVGLDGGKPVPRRAMKK